MFCRYFRFLRWKTICNPSITNEKKSFGLLPALFISLLLSQGSGIYAQNTFDTDIQKIADEEKKSFSHLQNTQPNTTNTYRVTAASNNYDIYYYRCEWEIDPAIRFINGKVTSYFTVTATTDKIVFDLSDTLTVDSIIYHGNQITYQRIADDGLQVQFPALIQIGQKDSVSVYYNGVPRQRPYFQPFVQIMHNGAPIIWTLSEPYGAKEWWPCKNGLNDKADSIDVLIKNPAAYQASSNGVLTQEIISGNTKVSNWKHRYPIATYLVALSVSNFTVLKDTITAGGRTMDLVNYAYPETQNDFQASQPFTKYILHLFTGKFGDYPFAKEKYGFTQIGLGNGGGMEHQTNSFINYPSTALISHETAHQWFGDKITCGSWQDCWLNEGFATYCQVLYFEDADKDLFFDTFKSLIRVITSLPDGSVWVNDTTDAGRVFDTRLTYYKGSYLLHMLRWKLGDVAFFSGIKRYLNDPLLKYGFARTSDLQRNLEQESGQNLSSFFNNWFYKQGYPTYSVEWTQDNNNTIYTKVNQTTSDASVPFFDMPVPIQFKNSSRDTIIVFNNIRNGETFLANPGFRADTAIFDPYNWILCYSSTKEIACTVSNNSDSLFPFYNIQWFQNTNNWIHFDISQTNSTASAAGDSIPLYLHFSGSGKDTVFVIKNTASSYTGWINAGFTVSNAFVTTSCLMSMNYTIANQGTNKNINEIKIFPVPATGNAINISIKNPSDKNLTISLINVSGQLLYQGKAATPGRDEIISVPVAKLPKGMYIIRLESESAIKLSRKIVR